MKATIVEIGKYACDGKEPMMILFGETTTELLKQYSVIQSIEQPETIQLKINDQIMIDDQIYEIDHVGAFTNQNLNSIQHLTMIFDAIPDDDIVANGIYLNPKKFPKLKIGSTIEYISK